jgi:hypothetical protein
MPPKLTYRILVSRTTAHVDGLDDKLTFHAPTLDRCEILASFARSMTSPHNRTYVSLDEVAAALHGLRNNYKLCAACVHAVTTLRHVDTLAAVQERNDALLKASRDVTRADVADLFTFDPDGLLNAAVNAIDGLLTDFDGADSDHYTTLSAAAAADKDARNTYWGHVSAMKKVMADALNAAGYAVSRQ